MIKFTRRLCFIVVLFPCCLFGQKNVSFADKEIDRLNKQHLFTGSVLYAIDGKILYEKNAGYANIGIKVPVSSHSRFELASLSKIFTAILILQLVEKGKLALNENVSHYLPEFSRNDSGIITIHHLLSHTSGLQDFVGLNCDFASWTKKEFMEGLQKTPIHFRPGSQFEYASSTYILLRYIIEEVTGKSYEDNLKENILSVSGMTNSGIIHNNEIIPNLTEGYDTSGSTYVHAANIANHEIFIGASSIYSTVHDLVKFDAALYTDRLLQKKEMELMTTIVKHPYGYGWFIDDDADKGKVLSYGGNVFGYTTLIERRLKNKGLIIILANQQDVDREQIKKILGSVK